MAISRHIKIGSTSAVKYLCLMRIARRMFTKLGKKDICNRLHVTHADYITKTLPYKHLPRVIQELYFFTKGKLHQDILRT